MKTRDETIRDVCAITALAYHSIGDYDLPSDGFCDQCPAHRMSDWNYQNAGKAIDFVRAAVVEKLNREGYKIAPDFDPVTGKEISR